MSNGNGIQIVLGYQGLGDNVYQRPAIKALLQRDRACFIKTSWPWVYHDMKGIRFLKPNTPLRTQKAHYDSLPRETWAHYPNAAIPRVKIKYGPQDFKAGRTPVEAFALLLKVTPVPAPLEPPPGLEDTLADMIQGRPFGVVHPSTVRREWNCPARNPAPGLIQRAVNLRPDLIWISIAWLKEGLEWLAEDPLTGITWRQEEGQLLTPEIAWLISKAEMTVAPPGYFLPLCQALGVGERAVIIFGGHVKPSSLLDYRLGPPPKIVAPEPFCNCCQNKHNCKREIPLARFYEILKGYQNA